MQRLAGAFVSASDLVDELVVYQAMTLMGSPMPDRRMRYLLHEMKEQRIRLQLLDSRMVGDDLKLTLHPVLPLSN